MNKTGFLFHPQYLHHDTKSHPENSGRLKAIQEKIDQLKKISNGIGVDYVFMDTSIPLKQTLSYYLLKRKSLIKI